MNGAKRWSTVGAIVMTGGIVNKQIALIQFPATAENEMQN
jgi:hypothetical protein